MGKLLSAHGVENSLESTKKAVAAIHQKVYGEPLSEKDIVDRANRARNALKHLNKDSPPTITFDVREEAKDMLKHVGITQ